MRLPFAILDRFVEAGGTFIDTSGNYAFWAPMEETVGAFAELVGSGLVGLLGVSNHWAWRVERARHLAASAGLPGYEVLQYHHTYLRRRTDLPGRWSEDGSPGRMTFNSVVIRSSGLPGQM